MISTKAHGTIDYILGVLLIIAPFIFGFATGGPEMWIPIIIGLSVIIYSLITAYELGTKSVITMRTHLWLDGIGGFILAISPWIFGFAHIVYLPHLLVGIIAILMAAITDRIPQDTPERAAV